MICEYCGYGNEDNAPCCTQCGAPRGSAFGKVVSVTQSFREKLATLATPSVWPVVGVDVSAWNGNMDFEITRQKAQFVRIRAGYNDVGFDIRCDQNRRRCQDANLPFSLYWYTKAGLDYKRHARSFYTVWRDCPGNMEPTIDAEETLVDPLATSNWLYGLVQEFLGLSGGVYPDLYTSVGWWNARVSVGTWAQKLKLWVAHWTNLGTPLLPRDWKGWSYWQYSADGNGLGRAYGSLDGDLDMDLDRFNGTVDDFNQRYGTHILPLDVTPMPNEIKPLYQAQITASVLNLRAQPTANSSDLGDLKSGDILPVVEEKDGWCRVEGWISKSYTRRL